MVEPTKGAIGSSTEPRPTLQPNSWLSAFGDMKGLGATLGLQTTLYVGIEGVWHVCLFAVCYQCAPLVRLTRTPWGKRLIESSKNFVNSRSSPRWGNAATATTNFMKTPWKRASAEWFFFNKVFLPVSWPTKLALAAYLANRMQRQRQQQLEEAEEQQVKGAQVVAQILQEAHDATGTGKEPVACAGGVQEPTAFAASADTKPHSRIHDTGSKPDFR